VFWRDAQNATATEFATEVRYFAPLMSFIAGWNAASSRAADRGHGLTLQASHRPFRQGKARTARPSGTDSMAFAL
jgi:hypothetical protein